MLWLLRAMRTGSTLSMSLVLHMLVLVGVVVFSQKRVFSNMPQRVAIVHIGGMVSTTALQQKLVSERPKSTAPVQHIQSKISSSTITAKSLKSTTQTVAQDVPKPLAEKASQQVRLSQAKQLRSQQPKTVAASGKSPALGSNVSVPLPVKTQKSQALSSAAKPSGNAQKLAMQDIKGQAKQVAKQAIAPSKSVKASTVVNPTTKVFTKTDVAKDSKQADRLAADKRLAERRRAAAQLEEAARKKLAQQAQAKQLEDKRRADQLALKQRQLEAERAADKRLLAQSSQAIIQRLQVFYILPPGLEGQLKTVLTVMLNDSGDVQAVKLKQSSGDEHHDRAAVAAIKKATPLPLPSKPSVRDQFKHFDITVSPQSMDKSAG